ncbi:MAG: hypothetical protein AVDCRST_MAG20-488, partial [uncultured Acidimicrobiales bacterium]
CTVGRQPLMVSARRVGRLSRTSPGGSCGCAILPRSCAASRSRAHCG